MEDIRRLDFLVSESHNPGEDAAKCLLAHIRTVDPEVDKYAHFNVAHQDLMQNFGWEYVGRFTCENGATHSGKLPILPRNIASWVLRGVPGSKKVAAPAATNSCVPQMPGSAELNKLPSDCNIG